jgi:GNAT superfamily N-acetyltransferase
MTGLRVATSHDIPAMHEVRMSVRENVLSNPASIDAKDYRDMLERRGRGWVYELDGRVVGFAVGDHSARNIWALFVQPGFEGRGIGHALHDAMVAWLFEKGSEPIWLTTTPGTRAQRFYESAGWICSGHAQNGEVRFEMRVPGSLQA